MKRSETTVLLAKIAAYDRRTVGEADVEAWSEVMTKNHINLGDALSAVVDHFSSSRDFLMPIHIVEKVRANNRDWWQRVGVPPVPGELTWKQEKEWRAIWCSAVKDGDVDPEGTANRAMTITPAPIEENRARVRAIEALARSKSIPGEGAA